MENHSENHDVSISKGLVVTLVAVVAVALIIVGAHFLKLKNIWIPFLGLCIWTFNAPSMEMREMAKVWIGGAVGIAIGVLMAWSPLHFGMAGLTIPLVAILIFIFCKVRQKLDLLFNSSTAIFLTVVTAALLPFYEVMKPMLSTTIDPHKFEMIKIGFTIDYFKDLVYGMFLFWFLPLIIKQVATRKMTKKQLPEAQ